MVLPKGTTKYPQQEDDEQGGACVGIATQSWFIKLTSLKLAQLVRCSRLVALASILRSWRYQHTNERVRGELGYQAIRVQSSLRAQALLFTSAI